jgi:hypothetical protein
VVLGVTLTILQRPVKLAAWFVRQIGLPYAVEKKLREQKAGPALRQSCLRAALCW